MSDDILDAIHFSDCLKTQNDVDRFLRELEKPAPPITPRMKALLKEFKRRTYIDEKGRRVFRDE